MDAVVSDVDNFDGQREKLFDVCEGIQFIRSQANFLQIGALRQIRNAKKLPVGAAQLGQIRQGMKHLLGQLLDGIVGQDDGVEGCGKDGGGREEGEIIVVEDESFKGS